MKHINISIGFHIPELQQSWPHYGEITVFLDESVGKFCG